MRYQIEQFVMGKHNHTYPLPMLNKPPNPEQILLPLNILVCFWEELLLRQLPFSKICLFLLHHSIRQLRSLELIKFWKKKIKTIFGKKNNAYVFFYLKLLNRIIKKFQKFNKFFWFFFFQYFFRPFESVLKNLPNSFSFTQFSCQT